MTAMRHVPKTDFHQSTATGFPCFGNTAETTQTQSTLLQSDTLIIQAGMLRTEINNLSGEIIEVHHATQGHDLQQRAAVKARHGVSTLLEELAVDRGMAWADIARLVGVSVSAVRKWRTGGKSTAVNRKELAELAAFLDLLEESSVEDPAQWMEVTFHLPPGYNIRPVELYAQGYRAELLDIACQRRDADDVLDDIDPSWRDARRSTVEVFTAPDGQPALRVRDSQ